MEEITELEERINDSISKIRLAMTQKERIVEKDEHQKSSIIERCQTLEKENERIKEKFTLLQKQHESDLKIVDTLLEKLNVILEDKNG